MKIVNESKSKALCAHCLDKTQTNDNCLGSTNPVNPFEEPKMSTKDFKVASPPTQPEILSIRGLSKPLTDRESTAYDYTVYWLSHDCLALDRSPFLSRSLSLFPSLPEAPSAQMKEIFIGFCSDLSGFVVRFLMAKYASRSPAAPSLGPSSPRSVYMVFIQICMFISLMPNYEILPPAAPRSSQLSAECFGQFKLVIMAFLCTECIQI